MASKACMELPPVSAEYTPKGRWDTVAGLKTYITGPEDATSAIIDIYDVFGPAPQTLQGADRLAEHLPTALVLVPDFTEGEYCQAAWFPPDTEEKQAKLKDFMAGPANFERNVDKVLEVRREIGARWPGVEEHVAVGGLCWGGKVAVLACGEGNEGKGRRFTASWTAHPGRLEAKDAEALTVPHICLASPGEPADVVAQYKEILSRPGKTGHVETYGDMFHGWMGAKAKLNDEKNAKEFERGYRQVAEFLAKYI
ncbi:Dienelactone hydrolase family protein [Pleurostoma richardsiae]|uniref:Dienelactone hydrolase family protein n=1 Tax=Pleurostoma richardsiae TaxID=41990 RepID=A0AA38VJW9_9PEZI|nr:Dienelactone hydrolase family protein [Pleurostoma richardsiae]